MAFACYQHMDYTGMWMPQADMCTSWISADARTASPPPGSDFSLSTFDSRTGSPAPSSDWSLSSASRPASPELCESAPRPLCLDSLLARAESQPERLTPKLEAQLASLEWEFQVSDLAEEQAMVRATELLSRVPPARVVRGMVLPLSLDAEGCRLVQQALEASDAAAGRSIIGEFQGQVRRALESPHANHVLQRAVELLPPAATKFLLDEIVRTWDLASVVQHKFGCRFLERVFEHFTASREASQDLTFYLSSGLFGDVSAHCFHIFGTHVMQNVLEYGAAEQQNIVWQALKCNLRKAAVDEYAVGVLDKALTFLPHDEQRSLAKSLVEQGVFHNMALSWRGQDAAERVLRIAQGPVLAAALAQVEEHRSALRRSKSGRAILALALRRSA